MSDEYKEDGLIRDMGDSFLWMDEALPRLREELSCMEEHWASFHSLLDVNNRDGVTEEIAIETASHIYALIAHATSMSKHMYEVGDVVFTWIAPQEVKMELIKDSLEQNAGRPMSVVHQGDGFAILKEEEFVIPDDLSGEEVGE